jgi:hypothetical protein
MKTKLLFTSALFVLSLTQAQAGFVGVYDYLSALPQPFVAQTGSEKWTFRNGEQNGALMGVYGPSLNTYGNYGYYAQFGSAGGVGTSGGGSAGVNETPGIFTHTASSGFTSAVFTADSDFVAQSFVITHELVSNGNQGNGIDLTLRTVNGGNVVDRGTITILNTTSAQTVFSFGAGLQFAAGDQVVGLFSARGSYLYDHGWWDIALHEVQPSAVPDRTATVGLLAAGLLVIAASRRRTRRE